MNKVLAGRMRPGFRPPCTVSLFFFRFYLGSIILDGVNIVYCYCTSNTKKEIKQERTSVIKIVQISNCEITVAMLICFKFANNPFQILATLG